MPCPRLALLLSCLLLPISGMAQVSPPPLVPAPDEARQGPDTPGSEEDPYGGYEGEEEEEAEVDSPRGELIPREWPPSESLGRKIPRIALELLAGTGLGFLASTPGALLALTAAFCEGCDDSTSLFLLGISLGSMGLSFGTAAGVWGVGSIAWGEGRFRPTLVGSVVGTLAGLGVGLGLGLLGGAGGGLWLIPIFTFPVIGAIIAYETSHGSALEQKARERGPGMSVTPMVGMSPRGGIIGGLAGVF